MTRKPPVRPPARPQAAGSAEQPGASALDWGGMGGFEEDALGAGQRGMSLELGDSPGGSTIDPFATYGSGSLDFDEFDDAGSAPLQVDVLTTDLPPPPGRAPRASQLETGLRVEHARDLPSPDTPRGEELPVDPLVALEVSEYGEAPSGWLTTPLYAARVFARRVELRRELRRLKAQLVVAERRRDEALAEFATRLRPAVEAARAGSPELAEVQRVERLSGERVEASRALKEEFEQKCGVLDQADFDLQLTLGGLTEQVSALEKAALVAREAYSRAAAKEQRAQIELRAAREVGGREQAAGQLTAETATRITAFEQAAVALAPVTQAARDELAQREQPLRARLVEVAEVEKQRKGLARQRRELAAAYKQQLAQQGQSAGAAESELQRALTELGRELLRRPGTVSIGAREVAPVAEAAERVHQAAQALELMVRAEQSYHAEAARRGVLLLGSVTFVLVLLLIARVAFAS